MVGAGAGPSWSGVTARVVERGAAARIQHIAIIRFKIALIDVLRSHFCSLVQNTTPSYDTRDTVRKQFVAPAASALKGAERVVTRGSEATMMTRTEWQ